MCNNGECHELPEPIIENCTRDNIYDGILDNLVKTAEVAQQLETLDHETDQLSANLKYYVDDDFEEAQRFCAPIYVEFINQTPLDTLMAILKSLNPYILRQPEPLAALKAKGVPKVLTQYLEDGPQNTSPLTGLLASLQNN